VIASKSDISIHPLSHSASQRQGRCVRTADRTSAASTSYSYRLNQRAAANQAVMLTAMITQKPHTAQKAQGS